MDRIDAEQQRDAEAGAAGEFDRLFAVLAENLEQRAGMFLLKLLFEIDAAVKLAHLADFFLAS